MNRHILCWLFMIGCRSLYAAESGAASNVFRVTDRIWIKDPPNFSINVRVGPFSPWNSEQKQNVWSRGLGFEPIAYRYPGVADSGGEDWLEHSTSPSLAFWDCMKSGFWDGAKVDIYRQAETGMEMIRTAQVKKSISGAGTENKLYFTERGPAVQRGDVYVLRMTRHTLEPQHFRSNLFTAALGPAYGGLQVEHGRWEVDPTTFAPEGDSTASLKMTFDAAGAGWYWYVINKENWNRFNKGKTYRGQVWMRQEGVADGKVTLKIGVYARMLLDVGPEWRKYEFDVPVEDPIQAIPSDATPESRLDIRVSGPGTVWVDNFLIWQTDVEPFALMPAFVDALKELKPHALRYWAMLNHNSLEGVLNRGFAQRTSGTIKGKVDEPDGYTLDVFLNLCAETGADPWINLHPFYTRQELHRLMEYLAAPPDQGEGKLRAAHGRTEPWTKTFKHIYFECANEAWNSIFAPLAWPDNPVLYSHIADREFMDVKASPFYSAETFKLIANGWDSGLKRGFWTPTVVENCKHADIIDVAHYFGGWEKGAGGEGSDEVFADKLLSTPIEMERKMLTALGLNPDFPRHMALALAGDAETTKALLEGYKPAQSWTESNGAAVKGLDAAAALQALFVSDAGWTQEMDRGFARYVETADNPLKFLGNATAAKDPAAMNLLAEWIGLDADTVGRMAGANNVLGSFTLQRYTQLLKGQSAKIDALLANTNLTWGSASNELEKVRAGEDCGWGPVNVIRLGIEARVRELARQGDATMLDALEATISQAVMADGIKASGQSLAGLLRKARLRRGDLLLYGMQKDTEFASKICRAISEGPAIFLPPARAMAAEVAAACEKSMNSAGEKTPILWPCLPPETQRKALAFIRAECEKPGLAVDVPTRAFLRASYAYWGGDPEAFRKAGADPAVHEALAAGLAESFVDTILQMALNNATLGDRLAEVVMIVPEGKGGKRLAVYEGGPGYALPGPGKPPNENDENVGKSLALGTATLDMMLMCLTYGASPLAYYDFKTGPYWATHSDPINMIPYPSWLAMLMRNRYCAGDLLRVEPVSVAALDVPDKEIIRTTNDGKGVKAKVTGRMAIPLVKCYAFRDGKKHSFILINRSFTEAQAVRLELPYEPSRSGILRKLTDPDPRRNNRREYQIKIVDQKLNDVSPAYTVKVPPGSVYILENEAK